MMYSMINVLSSFAFFLCFFFSLNREQLSTLLNCWKALASVRWQNSPTHQWPNHSSWAPAHSSSVCARQFSPATFLFLLPIYCLTYHGPPVFPLRVMTWKWRWSSQTLYSYILCQKKISQNKQYFCHSCKILSLMTCIFERIVENI